MKLAYPAAISDSTVPLMGFYTAFEQSLDAIANLGYDAVELLVRHPEELSFAQLEKILAKRNLQAAAFATSPMLAQDKLTLIDKDPSVREEAFVRTKKLIDLAAMFHAPVVIGKFRGNIQDDPCCGMKQLNEVFARLCDYCENKDSFIVMEPQKQDIINNLNTIDEATSWLKAFKSDKLKLLVDTFHMDFTEQNQCDSILKADGDIGFVHLSDTERLPVGDGKLDFSAIFAAFEKIAYQGFFSMEIFQKPSSREAAKKTIDNLKSMRM